MHEHRKEDLKEDYSAICFFYIQKAENAYCFGLRELRNMNTNEGTEEVLEKPRVKFCVMSRFS